MPTRLRSFVLGASWRPLGAIVGSFLGALVGRSWGSLGALEAFGASSFGAIVEMEAVDQNKGCANLRLAVADFAPPPPPVGTLNIFLGSSWAALGALWGVPVGRPSENAPVLAIHLSAGGGWRERPRSRSPFGENALALAK